MTRTIKRSAALALVLALMLSLAACGAKAEGLWANATYTEDTELGEGATTITVEVTAEDKTVTFTIHTDGTTLRQALEENGLIAGDESDYGLYITTVDGEEAVYENDGAYWAFYVGEDYASQGVETTPVEDGATYSLVYTTD